MNGKISAVRLQPVATRSIPVQKNASNLVYTQQVDGSNPSPPTISRRINDLIRQEIICAGVVVTVDR